MNFNRLYLSRNITEACKIYLLQINVDMLRYIDDFVSLINDNNGFIIWGWYKRGISNEKRIIVDYGQGNAQIIDPNRPVW